MRTLSAASIFDKELKPGECYIEQLAVSRDFRGKGIGRILIEKAKDYAQSIPSCTHCSLTVASENSIAIKLYKSAGFKTQEVEKSYVTRKLTGISSWEYMVCPLQELEKK